MWSAPVTVTPPAVEPIDLDAAKVFLRIDGDDQDVEVGIYAKGARAEIESVSNTRIITQTVDVSADCFADLAHLPIGPVISVTSVAYRDGTGATVVLDAEAYELFGATFEHGIRAAPGVGWPIAGSFTGAITVRLVVGYGATAADIDDHVVLQLYRVLRGLAEERPVDVNAALVNHRIWLV